MTAVAPSEAIAEDPQAGREIDDGRPAPDPDPSRTRLRQTVPDLKTIRRSGRRLRRRSRHAAARVPLTRFGWSLLGLSFVARSAGWLLGWLELATMSALGLLLLLLAVPFAVGRTSVSTELELSSLRVVVGESAAGQLVVRNSGSGRQLPFELQLPVGEATARFAIPSLAAGQPHDELLIIPTERRGVIAVGPATAVRGDPLGLWSRGVPAGEQQLLYVHPRTVRLGRFSFGMRRDLEGNESNAVCNSDVAFHALREYEPGDDWRHVHWRSTARTNQLMVRQFADTRRSHVTVLLSADAGDYASDDEFETAVSAVASIGLQAMRDEQEVSFVCAGRRLPASNGVRLLDALAGVERRSRGGGFEANRMLLAGAGRQAGSVVLVTGSKVEPAEVRASAKRLSAAGTALGIRIDPAVVSTFSVVGGVPTISLAALDELRRVLQAAA